MEEGREKSEPRAKGSANQKPQVLTKEGPMTSSGVQNNDKFLKKSRGREELLVEAKRLEAENSQLHAKNKDLNSNLAAAQRHLQEMQEAFERENSELQDEIDDLDCKEAKEYIELLTEKLQFRDENPRLVPKNELLKLKLDAKILEVDQLESRLNADWERTNKEKQERFEIYKSEVRAMINDLGHKVAAENEEVFRTEIQEIKEGLLEVENLKDENSQLCTKTKDLELELNAANLKVFDKKWELKSAENFNRGMHKTVRILQAKVDDLDLKLKAEKKEVDDLKDWKVVLRKKNNKTRMDGSKSRNLNN